jgi:hypothetical protein
VSDALCVSPSDTKTVGLFSNRHRRARNERAQGEPHAANASAGMHGLDRSDAGCGSVAGASNLLARELLRLYGRVGNEGSLATGASRMERAPDHGWEGGSLAEQDSEA